MKDRPRTLHKDILNYAFRLAKLDYPETKYKVTKEENTIYVDQPFPDGSFAQVLAINIERG